MWLDRITFIDIETTGLHPDEHAVWEVAGIVYDVGAHQVLHRFSRQLRLTDEEIAAAEPDALAMNGFHERYDPDEAVPRGSFSLELTDLTRGTHLGGAQVSFDEERLRRLVESYGVHIGWHYHLVDVEAEARGYLRGWLRGQIDHGRYPSRVVTDGYLRGWLRGQIDHGRYPSRVVTDLRRVGYDIPWKSDALVDALNDIGATIPTRGDVHDAATDAEWACNIWRATYDLPPLGAVR